MEKIVDLKSEFFSINIALVFFLLFFGERAEILQICSKVAVWISCPVEYWSVFVILHSLPSIEHDDGTPIYSAHIDQYLKELWIVLIT